MPYTRNIHLHTRPCPPLPSSVLCTTSRHFILPAVAPSLLTGFARAVARGVGEYCSVIVIAGNMPFKSEIAPHLIVIELEQYDYGGATAIATVTLAASFSALVFINLVQAWNRRHQES